MRLVLFVWLSSYILLSSCHNVAIMIFHSYCSKLFIDETEREQTLNDSVNILQIEIQKRNAQHTNTDFITVVQR